MATPQLKDARFQYHSLLFQDPEFISEATSLKQYLYRKYPEIINEGLFTETSLRDLVTKPDLRKVVAMARYFDTNVEMVSYFMCEYHKYHGVNPKKIRTWPTKDGGVMVEVGSHVTREEYYATWSSVEELKAGRGERIRGAQNWPLLYAIYKALRHNKNWEQINELYEKSELYGYSGYPKQYNGTHELKKYFEKYKYTP